ncbi:MAG: pyruvate kinase alpha/beta domain-containing protein [Calditrichota bacterium]
MLSEETAIGEYPVAAVQTIVKIAREVEAVTETGTSVINIKHEDETALAHTAAILSREIEAAAILCPTSSGEAARAVARFRPDAPIVVVSDSPDVVGELTLYRGVHPRMMSLGGTLEERISAAIEHAKELELTAPGSKLVVVGGVPAGSGRTNLLLVHTISSNQN